MITIVLIAVITGFMYVLLRPKKDKTKTTSQSTIVQSTDIPFSQLGKGSITNDIERFHNRFIDSKTESNVSNKTSNVNQLNTESKVSDIKSKPRLSLPKTSVKREAKTKIKPLIKTSDKKGITSVSPQKKTSVNNTKQLKAILPKK